MMLGFLRPTGQYPVHPLALYERHYRMFREELGFTYVQSYYDAATTLTHALIVFANVVTTNMKATYAA